jgi:hypothetical protein
MGGRDDHITMVSHAGMTAFGGSKVEKNLGFGALYMLVAKPPFQCFCSLLSFSFDRQLKPDLILHNNGDTGSVSGAG